MNKRGKKQGTKSKDKEGSKEQGARSKEQGARMNPISVKVSLFSVG